MSVAKLTGSLAAGGVMAASLHADIDRSPVSLACRPFLSAACAYFVWNAIAARVGPIVGLQRRRIELPKVVTLVQDRLLMEFQGQ
jgi:hypothetical protein